MTMEANSPRGSISIWLVVAAIAFAAMGLLAIANPLITGEAAGYIVALCFLVAGFGSLISIMSADNGGHRIVGLAFGLMAIATGVLLAVYPLDGAVSLVWLIGAFFAASGLIEIASGLRPGAHRGWHLLLGAIDLLLGVFVLFLIPERALEMLAVLIGLSFITRALALLGMGLLLRRAGRATTEITNSSRKAHAGETGTRLGS